MPDPSAARLRAKKAAYRVEHELYALETRTVAEIRAELEVARRGVIATIATAQADWQIWQAKALLVEIERQLKAWAAVAANTAAGRLGDVADLGVEQALSALSAGRVGFAIGAGAMISRDFVAVAYQTMPMLISNIGDDVLRGVSSVLRQAVLAQRTPLDAMHEIGVLVGRGIFPSAFLRGEVIVRTEYGRIAQTANYSVLSDLARSQKSLRKEWSAVLDFRTRESHALADGQTVEVDAEYSIGGHDALYPHDPQLPADESINCRCISVPYDESWGAAGHWADRRLAAAFNPNEPRVPKGSPEGGEWTDGGGIDALWNKIPKGSVPERDRQILRDFGVTVRAPVTGLTPSGLNAEGTAYHPDEKAIVIWPGMETAILHEVGHAMDHALGNISQSAPYRALIRAEKKDPTVGRYIAQPRLGSWSYHGSLEAETYASIYAAAHGGDTPMYYREDSPLTRIAREARTPYLSESYDPNEPRVPAGSPEGGEWTAGESPLASGVYSASAAEYKIAFDAAFADNPRSAYVTHYTEAELQEMTLLLSNGGKTGQAIWDHGDGRIEATAVFNVSGIRGEGLRLLKEAVDDHGVNYLECFGPKLPEIYGTLGFRDTAVYPFDPAQAPKGWNYERDGTPDYHIMGLPK